MPDHVHMLLSIPPKYAVAQVVGYIKGKSAIHVARTFMERKRNFVGQHFWARGYFVLTVGRDEAIIRQYIRPQEIEDQRVDQLWLVQCSSDTFRWLTGPLASGPTHSRFERLTLLNPPALPGDI